MTDLITRIPAIGVPLARIEGREKVTGAARYATEQPGEGAVYAAIVAATVAAGTVTDVDGSEALARPGVIAVLSHANAPKLRSVSDPELAVLQSPEVAYRGQIVGCVVAGSLEEARSAARLVRVRYDGRAPDAELAFDRPDLTTPDKVNGGLPGVSVVGDAESALAAAAVTVDAMYETPAVHNNPMEPHATTASWEDGSLTLYDSTQGASTARSTIARVFGLDASQVRVISPHVGGGFGAKGTPRPHAVLAAMAARVVARPVKLAVSRHEMFSLVGYRTPTIQRIRLGADADGRLRAIDHDAVSQSSTLKEFVEQTAAPTRVMYAAADRRTTHRVARLDVPTPSWMRAPGECPGMFGLETAMDELAIACGLDPVELRLRNEPERDPESDLPWSSRGLTRCLREGAERFGWSDRDPRPGARLEDDRWLVGTGVAASTYPTYRAPSSARVRVEGTGYVVEIAAADIGTGARTVLTQIAADALGADVESVRVEIGDSALPYAQLAGGSMGTASWGTAVVRACEDLRRSGGDTGASDTTAEVKAQEEFARHAFGAQFAEVRVDVVSGEARVSRLLGVFGVGRVLNPATARSQLLGGMTMGLSMALHEESVMDPRFGAYVNHDLATYHVAACADVAEIEASWIDEVDEHVNPMGSKGIGEIGIVGTAAAIGNAIHHATGHRLRATPFRLDRLLTDVAR
jgi:xanthine dehydrogenase YagR molybdenum-binding subunit